jgi:siroheme synthase-like protein
VPLFLELDGARVVVTGGGLDAFAAARRLAGAGASVTLACPDASAAKAACTGCECEYHEGPPESAPLDGAVLLVAASEDPAADEAVLAAAAERGLLAVSQNGAPARGSLGAARSQGPVAVGVGSSGLCPELEERMVEEASSVLVPEVATFAEVLAGVRAKLAERYPDAERREQIWAQIFDSPVLALLQAGDEDEAVELAERMAWGTG